MLFRLTTKALPVVAGGALLGFSIFPLVAASVSDYAVRATCSVQASPPLVTLAWPPDGRATSYTLFRKAIPDAYWGEPVLLEPSATNYVDSDVTMGRGYEYWINKTTPGYDGDGYLGVGLELPLVEFRGKVLVLVDDSFSSVLATELARLELDLVGDGWAVVRRSMPRMAVAPGDANRSAWAARSNELARVKDLIKREYAADPDNVRAVFLFGHLPVPYSGDLYPDGHDAHRGAWPADVYYGDMAGLWTDSDVTRTGATDPRNWNVPGDGKFDWVIPFSEVQLQVGRVDLSSLPSFSQSEGELLRRYLNKDHAFRHKRMSAEARGLIDDELGLSTGEPFAVSGWRNFTAFFGVTNTVAGDWLTTLRSNSYLWGYGCGAGTYSSASGVATAAQLAVSDPKVVFTMLFGSYIGDWDSPDNLLRASLATPGYTLASVWAGRPAWQFHHMGLGATIGYCTRLNQNNSIYNLGTPPYVSIALMGDPTLRMHVVAPPSALAAAANDVGGVDLRWTESPDPVAGYAVYGAASWAGPFTRLNAELVQSAAYTDTNAAPSGCYMVRAVKLELTASGSYYNASQGIFQDLLGTFGPPTLTIARDSSQVVLSWPSTAFDWNLETCFALASPNWSRLTNAITTRDNTNLVTLTTAQDTRFFRLRQP